MSLISIEEFNEYSRNYEEVLLKDTIVSAAEDIVKEYLHYDPANQEYTELLSGLGDYNLQLNAKPITAITAVTVDDVALDVLTVNSRKANSEWIYNTEKECVFTQGVDNILITYTAGYTTIPGAIKLCTLRIAALLLTESGGNIGITSKSFDNNSRTFYQFTNYDKYLQSIETYQIKRLD